MMDASGVKSENSHRTDRSFHLPKQRRATSNKAVDIRTGVCAGRDRTNVLQQSAAKGDEV